MAALGAQPSTLQAKGLCMRVSKGSPPPLQCSSQQAAHAHPTFMLLLWQIVRVAPSPQAGPLHAMPPPSSTHLELHAMPPPSSTHLDAAAVAGVCGGARQRGGSAGPGGGSAAAAAVVGRAQCIGRQLVQLHGAVHGARHKAQAAGMKVT